MVSTLLFRNHLHSLFLNPVVTPWGQRSLPGTRRHLIWFSRLLPPSRAARLWPSQRGVHPLRWFQTVSTAVQEIWRGRAGALSCRKTPLLNLVRKTPAKGVPQEAGLMVMGRIKRVCVYLPGFWLYGRRIKSVKLASLMWTVYWKHKGHGAAVWILPSKWGDARKGCRKSGQPPPHGFPSSFEMIEMSWLHWCDQSPAPPPRAVSINATFSFSHWKRWDYPISEITKRRTGSQL